MNTAQLTTHIHDKETPSGTRDQFIKKHQANDGICAFPDGDEWA